MNRAEARKALQLLRSLKGVGSKFAAAALDAAEVIANHPSPGGWPECEQAERDYDNYVPRILSASIHEIAGAMREERLRETEGLDG